MIFEIGKYNIELQIDELFDNDSSDKLNQYQKVYFPES
jgi:hypothetical protein